MLQIKKTYRKQIPKLPLLPLKNKILGKDYELSVVFCSDYLIEKLSIKYKGSNKHKNILSFPLNKKMGEIFININQAKKEAKYFGHDEFEHVLFLYIHGLLHLSGIKHSKKMEELEEKLTKKYKKYIRN